MRSAVFLATPLAAAHRCQNRGRVISDWCFEVAGVSRDGFESPVAFPGPAGAFRAGTDTP